VTGQRGVIDLGQNNAVQDVYSFNPEEKGDFIIREPNTNAGPEDGPDDLEELDNWDADIVDEDRHKPQGPTHKSLFDDLVYYHKTFSNHLPEAPRPIDASIFAKKVVAGHYGTLLAFVTAQVKAMRSRGWTEEDGRASSEVEREWSRFRIAEYIEALFETIDALGVPGGPVQDSGVYGEWAGAVNADYQKLLTKFEKQRMAYNQITAAMVAFIDMKENRRSLTFARISFVFGLVLAPLVFLSQFFSMDPEYLPGGPLNKVYWAVSFTCMGVLLLLYRAVDWILRRYDIVGAWGRLSKIWRRLFPRRRRRRGKAAQAHVESQDLQQLQELPRT
jgi:hypothetical protein